MTARQWWCGLRYRHIPRDVLSSGPLYGTGPASFQCRRCGAHRFYGAAA